MLPGISPALFSQSPIVDANTLSLIKCNGNYGAFTSYTDFVKSTRVWGSGVGNATNAKGYFGTGWRSSVSSDRFMSPSNDADYNLRGDFTIDFWCAVSNIAVGYPILSRGRTAGNTGISYEVRMNGDQVLFVLSVDGTTANVLITSPTAIGIGTYAWFHVAVTREGNVFRLFLNGAQFATQTSSAVALTTSAPVIVGFDNVTYAPDMYMDELRFSNIARWSANFTPPKAPYYGAAMNGSNDAAAKFMLHADGANNSVVFTDAAIGKSHARTITTSGAAKISTAVSKFGGSSAYFDGSAGCRLSLPNSPDFDFLYADFTIDFWFYRTTGTTGFKVIAGKITANNYAPWMIYCDNATGSVQFYALAQGWLGMRRMSFGTATLNTWVHFAVVRSNGAVKGYANGTQAGTIASLGPLWVNNDNTSIGGSSDNLNLTGYLDEFRISDVARWTSNFTPPTTAYVP